MNRNIGRLECRRDMFEASRTPDKLSVKPWDGRKIPRKVRASAREERDLGVGGVYGGPEVGDPVHHHHLKLVTPGPVLEIEIFNRGITPCFSADERARRIQRVLATQDRR